MGNQAEINNLTVGEIEFSTDGKLATISCFLTEEVNISVIVQDEIGRPKIEEQYTLEKGYGHFGFDISNLTEGPYHAWIDLMGKTFIRSFQIQKINGNYSWLKKLKVIFG